MNKTSAISKINKFGVLIVFPVQNRKDPPSLWSHLFPKTRMDWDWSEDSGHKVSDMWHLMKRLSDCREVIYSKWYQGRATFFSIELFTTLLRLLREERNPEDFSSSALSPVARSLLETLEMDSPLSTRELKKRTELQGKLHEAAYQRGTRELFSKFLAVGFGEVDDGAFPSLALGATRSLYEDVWNASEELGKEQALITLNKYMPEGTLFRRHLKKVTGIP